ncbi:hypothetical protein ACU4GD_08645 [Cupriavidus basilensis]
MNSLTSTPGNPGNPGDPAGSLPARPHHRDLAHQGSAAKLSYRMVDTAGALPRCIDTLLDAPQRPDSVVITGDLVDFGNRAGIPLPA